MKFGFIFFSSGESKGGTGKYELLLESARFADANDFSAVWVPERHFTQEGCLFPNPVVVQAALARETRNIRLRAGSVVLPLHHPVRVVEDWAVVDNLSGGRVEISIASGWHPDDFIFFPDRFERRQEVMYEGLEQVRRLWRGESLPFDNGLGESVEVRALPTPLQPELPFWLTAAGNPKTFEKAGELGAGLLTHMFNQDVDTLAQRVALYREGRARAGHDPAAGPVAVMFHTYVADDFENRRGEACDALGGYVRSARFLLKAIAASRGAEVDVDALSDAEQVEYWRFVSERLISDQRVLFGSPEGVLDLVARLEAAGVDEIACQIDFASVEVMLPLLPSLGRLNELCAGEEYRRRVEEYRRQRFGDTPAVVMVDPLGLDAVRGRCTTEIETSDLEGLWKGEGEALGRIRGGTAAPSAFTFYPQLLEVGSRVLRSTLPEDGASRSADWRTVSLESFDFHRAPAAGELWSHARLLPKADGERLRGEIRWLDSGGELVAHFRGLELEVVGTGSESEEAGAVPEAAEAGGTAPSPSLRALLAVPGEERVEMVIEAIAGELARVLKMRRSKLDLHQPLNALGLDSLTAIELRNRVKAESGIEIPITSLLKSPSLGELGAELAGTLPSRELAEGGASEAAGEPDREAAWAARSGPFALSEGQRALWFLKQLIPDNPAYNILLAARSQGIVDLDLLERSLELLAARHPALRTLFVEEAGEAMQVILPAAPVELKRVDADGWSAAELEARITAEADRPFDLVEGPVARFYFFEEGPGEGTFVLAVHHIAVDFSSFDLLLEDLRTVYGKLAAGDEVSPAPRALPYSEYVTWQQATVESPEGERQWRYWRERMGGELAPLNLATDRPRPSVQSLDGETLELRLPEPLVSSLRALAQRLSSTLNATLLAGFQALLHRYTGQRDLRVGSPVVGRTRRWFEDLVGYFVNPVVFRTEVAPEGTFEALVRQVSEVTWGAIENQDFPFPALVRRLHPERDLSRSPVFQVAFVWIQPQRFEGLEDHSSAGLRLQTTRIEQRGAPFELSAVLVEEPETISGRFQYNTAIFDRTTVRRMMEHLHRLLEGMAADPGRTVGELPLLAPSQQHQLDREWNDTAVALPRTAVGPETIVGAVARRSAARTDAWAVYASGRELLLGELHRQARELAAVLNGRGVGPESLVGVCLLPGIDLPVALLGVMTAGAAYVPLDPSYPEERLTFMAADAGLGALVTQAALAGLAERISPAGIEPLILDGSAVETPPPVPLPAWRPDQGPAPDQLAYVIYTSGSTGRPKGVQVSHRALSNFLSSMARRPGLTEEDRLLAVTSLSFDIAGLELYLPLLTGAGLEIADRETAADGALLARYLEDREITALQATPTTWQLLVAADWRPSRAGFKALCGGEALPPELARELLERGAEVWNLYGPTETTIWSAVERLAPDEPVLLGRPIDNTSVLLLDGQGRPVPPGVPGELVIGGDGLARGYRGRPALTAERFVPRSGAAPAGSRLYRTGDLARQRADGRLEYLGRFDHQVKVRGFRIELGEIETALAARKGVRRAVVAARRDVASDPVLVAYVVADEGVSPAERDLREALRRSLPEYMVPALFVFLDELPLTPNGKVDRKALPAPEAGALERGFVAPENQLQATLAAVWESLLSRERVGIYDNFFDLGGHSLLAGRLLARLRHLLGVDLPLRALFEAPTVAQLAARVEARSERAGEPPLRRVERGVPLPLSFAQERLLFIHQMQPESPAYNMAAGLALSGTLDAGALERALWRLEDRHEVLRTTFILHGGAQRQVVAPSRRDPLTVLDLSGLASEERRDGAVARAEGLMRASFDLAAGPVFRGYLLRLGEAEHWFVLTSHHIVLDGSFELCLREVMSLYGDETGDRPAVLASLPVQYADYAAWQRRLLQGEYLEEQLAYWKRQLEGRTEVLQLPTDRIRPAVRAFRGARRSFAFDPAPSAAAAALARQREVTPFMLTLAAFEILMARLSEQASFAVGTPIIDRPRVETENLLGNFVNTLVLVSDASPGGTVGELLERVRDTVLGANAHKELPFEMLVEHLQPERDLSHSPLFQVMFVLEQRSEEALGLPGLEVAPLTFDSGASRFDLLFALLEEEGRLTGFVEYDSDLFDPSTVDRLVGCYGTLLAALPEAAAAGSPTAALPLLRPAQRRQVLEEWNDTARRYPRDLTLPALFEAQVRRAPEALAVVMGDNSLSYRELDEAANRLAWQLRELGVRRSEWVAVHLARSIETVVAVLAIHKAGGAYVPLEVSLPASRRDWILESLGVRVILTDDEALSVLAESDLLSSRASALETAVCLPPAVGEASPQPGGLRRLGPEELASQPSSPPLAVAEPGDVAYVIFTSGSTGTPKGVYVRHRPVANLIDWVNREFGVGPRDRVLFVTPLSFDLSVYDIFGLLSAGGSIRVASPREVGDPERLVEILETEPVTFWDSAPAALQHLVPVLPEEPRESAGLRLVFLSGDWIPVGLPDRVRTAFPGARVVSLGGATEATVWSNFFPIGEVPEEWRSIPYGRPIQNARYHVLDGLLEPQPVGVPGDLYIAGECLAAGYFGSPALTAEKFLPDPFTGRRAGRPGARLYRTGDRARYWADGNLEFLGRLDGQVKIRGFRIELGEIEATLKRHPEVEECLAVAWPLGQQGPGVDRRLVAYVVVPEGSAARRELSRELKEAAQERLPEYMVPAAVVQLESLPMTVNGKVDRKALPAPDFAGQGQQAAYVAPRTLTEQVLSGQWQELLQVPRVGGRDDFFELGGHSLLAIQLVTRVRQAFEVELPLRSLFENRTVSSLADTIDELRRAGAAPALPAIEAMPEGKEAVPSYAQERLWFLDQLEPGNAAYNIPGAARLVGALSVEDMEAAVAEVYRRHPVLLTVFPRVDGRAAVKKRGLPHRPLPLTDLSGLPSNRREAHARGLIDAEARQPFRLAEGPLCRFRLLRLEAREHLLLATFHHIVADDWSMGIVVRDLAELYDGRVRGLPELPAPTTVAYEDYAYWQRNWLVGDVLEQQLGFWREVLGSPARGTGPAMLDLPTDRPAPAVMDPRGESTALELSEELSRRLEEVSRQQGATLFMTLLAAFQVLLSRLSGQDDVVVGAPIANRDRAEVADLVGCFVNTVVLRTDLAGAGTFSEVLERVRRMTLGAFAHQQVPFERVVEDLKPRRDPARNPLFDVFFNYLEMIDLGCDAGGLEISPVAAGELQAKFWLTLYVGHNEGRIRFEAVYQKALFDGARMEQLLKQLELLLEQVAEAPDADLAPMSLRTAASRSLLADPAVPLQEPELPTVPESLWSWAERQPEAVAVRQGGRSWTYWDLVDAAEPLARQLVARDRSRGEVVAVTGPRSFALVVALSAILRSGKVLLTLDPNLPKERRQLMAREAGASLLLCIEGPDGDNADLRLEGPGEESANLESAHLDRDTAVLAAAGGAVPAALAGAAEVSLPVLSGDDPAYVFFTSGSTGLPKGVLGTHKGVAHFVDWERRELGVTSSDRVAMLTALSFDALLRDVFLPLTSGASLCLPVDESSLAPKRVIPWLAEERISILHTLPALAKTWLANLGEEVRVPELRWVLFSGEPLSGDLVRRWRERFRSAGASGGGVMNLYGPTETTMIKTFYPVPEGAEGPICAGRPLPQTQVLVLGEGDRLCGVGEVGEIVLRTPFRTLGYLNAPAEQARAFIVNPFREGAGSEGPKADLLYRTGDLGRYRPDGSLEVLGRKDDQVKIRGVRVEPGEVEAVLQRHPAVETCAVVVRRDEAPPGEAAEPRLVAYWVGEETGVEELRGFLGRSLTTNHLPGAFVHLEELPLTASGKLDLRALPAPQAGRRGLAADYVAPRSDLETIIAAAWCEALGLDRVGTEDNFFDLGGHSLLVVEVQTRLEGKLQREIPLVDLFQFTSVGALARHLGSDGRPPVAASAAVDEGRLARRQSQLGRQRNLRQRRQR